MAVRRADRPVDPTKETRPVVVVRGPKGDPGAPGVVGADGAVGPQGPAGPGVAAGGSTGQALTKSSGTDYDTGWTSIVPASGGTFTGSVTAPAVRTGDVGTSTTKITITDTDGTTGRYKMTAATVGDQSKPVVYIKNTGGTDGNYIGLMVDGYSVLGGFRINGADNPRSLRKYGQLGFATADASPITFTINEWTERARIDSNGNVGIGDAAPSEKLTVAGNIKLAGSLGVNGATPAAKPTITGSRGGNAALASLLTALAAMGLITDGTTA